MDVFGLLTQTYPRYVDQASRNAVEGVGMELIRQDEQKETKSGVTEQVLGWLSVEVGGISRKGSPASQAATDVFVLFNWVCGLYTVCLKSSPDFDKSNSWPVVLNLVATLLDLLLSPTSHVKPNIRRSAVTRVRSALRPVSYLSSFPRSGR